MKDMSKRPKIGVTGPVDGGTAAWLSTKLMIWLNGGRAVRITPDHPVSIHELHGLVIGGGADIHPARYKEELLSTIKTETKHARHWNLAFIASVILWLFREWLSTHETRRRQDLKRDELEFQMLSQAAAYQIPVLGICRGSQLINVFWGGSLHQDTREFYAERPNLRTMRPRKLIHVESGTVLARILERTRAKVNSLHDQSVKDVAPDLKVCARESNGVIQAIEHKSLPFMLGVQWHPEFMPYRREQRRVFHHLVEAARVHSLGA
jgi:putative glutamine amidotransferase